MEKIINRLYTKIFYYMPQKPYTHLRYMKNLRKKLNLKNPKTLNEKLNWKKLYDHNPIYTRCADKYAVRDYVKEKIGEKYLIPLLYHTDRPEEIPFDKLKPPYIIKPNHCSGMYIIIKRKEDIDNKYILKLCKKWLKIDYYKYGKSWQYKNIPRKIVIERLILDEKGNLPNDYKFDCFNGKPEFVEVHTNKFKKYKNSYFDMKWNLLPFIWCNPKKNNNQEYKIDKDIPKPKNLNDMIKIVKILSKDFDFVRVDLYSVKGKIYFGELTFHPASGFEPFFPSKWDIYWGKKLKLKGFKKK